MVKSNEAGVVGLVVVGLTAEQQAKLAECETVIKAGLETFLHTAKAFHEIFVDKLFKPEFPTFAEYCKVRWNLDDTTAFRYKDAGEVLYDLKDESTLPQNEGQCRELVKCPQENRVKVWRKVVKAAETSGEKITAKLIKSKVPSKATQDSATQTTPATTITAVVEIEAIHANIMECQGFVITPAGEGRYSIAINGTRAEALKALSVWKALDNLKSLSISFA